MENHNRRSIASPGSNLKYKLHIQTTISVDNQLDLDSKIQNIIREEMYKDVFDEIYWKVYRNIERELNKDFI